MTRAPGLPASNFELLQFPDGVELGFEMGRQFSDDFVEPLAKPVLFGNGQPSERSPVIQAGSGSPGVRGMHRMS